MFEIIEELGLTIEEVIGSAFVFVGFAGGMAFLSRYGFQFIQILVG